jgi:uncharacterized phage protein (TIGR01671 family)
MKRPIRFRVWDELEKQMVGWENAEDTELLKHAFHGQDAVAMQFTGLKDSDGLDIYEGDILKVVTNKSESIYTIVYDLSGFKCKNALEYKFPLENYTEPNTKKLKDVFADSKLDLTDLLSTKSYVVGNIFVGTELLNGKAN